MGNDYKNTMNLPQTDFPMRAGLPKSEPVRLKKWEDEDLYGKVLEKNKDNEPFILHDGPPYANGPIHIGHAFNKTIKDFVLKSKSQQGYFTPYTPGWDCHGQPIEHEVEKKLGTEKMRELPQNTVRRLCREWAEKYVDIQREGFKRLGVRGDWDHPYLTFLPTYEAANVEIFKKMYETGAIYRGRKPIHWCAHCHTALAEAEIEYADETSPAIFVRFEMTTVPEGLEAYEGKLDVAIWTTTPWTLPADEAVILHPDADYVAALHDGRAYIFAEALAAPCFEKFGWGTPTLATGADGEVWRVKGASLAGNRYKQPIFGDQGAEGKFIYADYVTLDDGTGIVHGAPGHGVDDYNAGMKFGIPVTMPVDDDGCFYTGEGMGTGGPWSGMEVNAANPKIIEWLKERGTLILHEDIDHSYPHCWRCHEPVIFRATDQWFVSMDETGLRDLALETIGKVDFHPDWAVNRITAMVSDRPDWCISRQRSWGVPIPVFKCKKCGETVATPETFDAVIELFRTEGADAWFAKEPAEYLPEGTACPACGCTEVVPEKDILDVWWESGVSHTAVCDSETFPLLQRPADMYLEGSDQHRGWFQSSLLTSVGAYGIAPYKEVVSCGFTVDGEGRKMSKSLGNGVDPADVIAQSGADVLRLWVAGADYSYDVSISDEIIKRSSETYRRFRNTFRFLLSNLYDFDDVEDVVSWNEMPQVDRWAMVRLAKLRDEVTTAYNEYKFYVVYRLVNEYFGELSSVYMDMLKDRLYSDAPKSVGRRSAQTVLANVLECLVRMLCPIISFTCDEVWDYYPESMKKNYENRPFSVQLAGWPERLDFTPEIPEGADDEILAQFEHLLAARDVVTKAIEDARNAKVIGKSQEAAVTLSAPAETIKVLSDFGEEALEEFFIVAHVDLKEADGDMAAEVAPAAGDKCPRCWNIRELGSDGLCERCSDVIGSLEA